MSKQKSHALCLLLVCGLFLQLTFAQSQPMRNETKAVVRSNSEFALAAYARMSRSEGNLFFSPFSLSAALTMAYGGAKGETAKQIASVLHVNSDQKNVHAEMAALLKQLAVKEQYEQLFIANALWAQRGLTVLEPYQNLLRTNYNSELLTVDFVDDAQATATAINEWAKQNTNGRITNIVTPNSFHKDTLLYLTNAIYFNARWEQDFSGEATETDDFWISQTEKTKVKMMQQSGHFPYFDDATVQVLEMPYVEHFSIVVVLPKVRMGLPELEQQLNAGRLEQWLSTKKRQEVKVFFPKFEMEADLSLKTLLTNLGMPLAFQDKADFSDLAKSDRGIKLDNAIQKTFIKVDEEGTEAAAVTALAAAAGAAMGRPDDPPPPIFRADHPFLFFIKENSTSSILFMGRVTNPNQKQIKFADQASSQSQISATPNTGSPPSPSASPMTNDDSTSSVRNWGIGLGVLLAFLAGAFFAFKRTSG